MLDGFSVPAITKAELVEEVWAEVARHQAGAGAGRQALLASPLEAAPITLALIPTALSLPELLALDDEAFIAAAYHTLLRRPPDPAGIDMLTAQLAAGTSRVVLLGRLRRSAEGRAIGQQLPGLGRRFVIHRVYHVPGLGPGLRFAAAAVQRLGLARVLGGATELPAVSQAQMQAYVGAHAAAADHKREALERRLGEQQMALDLATRRLALLQSALDATNRKAVEASRTVTRQLGPDGRRLTTIEDRLAGSPTAALERLVRLEALVSAEATCERVEAAAGSLRRDLQDRMQTAEAAASQANLAVAGQQQRLAVIIDALRIEPATRPLAAAFDQQTAGEPDNSSPGATLDDLYVAFEDVFRGSRAAIKERQRFYLPILLEARAGTPERPVADLGCGRGEFLELLRDHGLAGRGVDANVTMSELCRELGLAVVVDDAVSYLARQDAGSLGAVTGFHIAEHLPFKTIVRLLDEALRALAPGGLLILETPNPANLIVASHTFYLDPTHLNPLPGQMMVMIAQARGFDPAFVAELHPTQKKFGGNDPVLQAELDALFHGPQDYALIARKP